MDGETGSVWRADESSALKGLPGDESSPLHEGRLTFAAPIHGARVCRRPLASIETMGARMPSSALL